MKHNYFLLSALASLTGLQPSLQTASFSGDLGVAETFAVLGSAGVTSTGPTIINGDLGAFPTISITGFPPGIVTGTAVGGTIYAGGVVAQQARIDAAAAWVALGLETPTANLSGNILGSAGYTTLFPGIYRFNTTAQLTGTLILDALGDPTARFDFQIGTDLTTASASAIVLAGGADGENVYWQVGSGATLGTSTMFVGTIIANTEAITLNTGAAIDCGRALALTAAVTLDSNNITLCLNSVPEAGFFGAWVAGIPLVGLFQWFVVRRGK